MGTSLNTLTQMTRKFMNDFPHLNELRGVAECDEPDLRLYAVMALDDYNSSPPLITPVSFENHPSVQLLMLGTICYAFLSKGILQLRNNLQYNDGGIVVNIWDKGPAYAGNAASFGQMWEMKKLNLKRSINLMNGFGIVMSAEFNMYNYASYFGTDYALNPVGGTNIPMIFGPSTGQAPTIKHALYDVTTNDWTLDPVDNSLYQFVFIHNLSSVNVGVAINDLNGYDITDKTDIQRVSKDQITVRVSVSPDGRFAGKVQAFIL